MKMVQRTCARCRKKFMAREADVKRGWAKCCSRSCAASRRNRETGVLDRILGAGCAEDDAVFANAHLHSHEDHDCNKSS